MRILPSDLFRQCLHRRFMVGAFNVFNLDVLWAVLSAAEAEGSPVIVQVSMGARKYAVDFPFFLEIIALAARRATVPVMLQHDHCSSVDECVRAIDWGIPAVMFDGSHLPFEENITQTRQVVEYARCKGAWVEAELGRLPGFEDEVFSDGNEYTDPVQAAEFVDRSGCNALAVAVGTSHGGVLSDDSLPLSFERLEALHRALPGFPLVLHGGASLSRELIDKVNAVGGKVPYLRNVSEADIGRCREYGVCKVNMDVDNFMAYTTAVRCSLLDAPEKYDPRGYLGKGRDAFTRQVRRKMRRVLHSAGQAVPQEGEKVKM